jgi:hypothetical protein
MRLASSFAAGHGPVERPGSFDIEGAGSDAFGVASGPRFVAVGVDVVAG